MSRLIDANALKTKKRYSFEFHENVVAVAEIDWMPTVDAVPVVHSRWKHGVCENCRFDWAEVSIFASVPNYCPNCGAVMDGKRKDGAE